MTSTVVQHSVEVVGNTVDFALFDRADGLNAVVWETVDAELVCAAPVADTVACSDVDMRTGVVLECTVDTAAPVVLDCSVVDIVLDGPLCCTLGDIAVVFGCTVDDCRCGVGTAFAVAC